MEEEAKSPIENNPELLLEYGRAFYCINWVEFLLEKLILSRGKLNLIDSEIRKKLIDRKTLGQKIELSSSLLEVGLVEELKFLNEKRNLIAHGTVSKVLASFNTKINQVEIQPGDYLLGNNGKKEIITSDSLKEISKLAKSVASKLMIIGVF